MEENHYLNASNTSFVDNAADIINNWALELEMSLEKKIYQCYEIDFLTFFSISQIITKCSMFDLEKSNVKENMYIYIFNLSFYKAIEQ